jgi:uncharacterized membrane protein
MKPVFLYVMSLFYIAAGIFHFIQPAFYLKIMPPWLPWHLPIVYISGVCEIVLGCLLIPEATRSTAAWGIILLLVAVFPANVQMMLNYWDKNQFYLSIAILRLPLQVVLIIWAWRYT